LIIFHLIFLHNSGRTSKIFVFVINEKINFFPFYGFKDIFNIIIFLIFFIFVFFFPFYLGDHEIFLEADPLNSPVHIVPE
jgi:quinol-cytochrome oxidoreductase complex cytochrome b subunit